MDAIAREAGGEGGDGVMVIKVDKEFHSLIPPLSCEERGQLEANVVADGCRDPLVTWNGTLLDGHNRYEICTRRKIPYTTAAIELPNRHAARAWIAANQLGRRNLSDNARYYLLGIQQREEKAAQTGAPKGNRNAAKTMGAESTRCFESPERTAERIGKQHGVNPSTVKRAEKYADAVDKIASEYGDNAKHAIVDRDRAGYSAAKRIVEAPKPQRDKMVKAIIEAPDKFAAKKAVAPSPIKRGLQSKYTLTGAWMGGLRDQARKIRSLTTKSPLFWDTMCVQELIWSLNEYIEKKLGQKDERVKQAADADRNQSEATTP